MKYKIKVNWVEVEKALIAWTFVWNVAIPIWIIFDLHFTYIIGLIMLAIAWIIWFYAKIIIPSHHQKENLKK